MDAFTYLMHAAQFVGATVAEIGAHRYNGVTGFIPDAATTVVASGGRGNAAYIETTDDIEVLGTGTGGRRWAFHHRTDGLNSRIFVLSSGGVRRGELVSNVDGTLSWKHTGSTVTIATSTLAIAADTEVFISIDATISTTASGAVRVHVNDVLFFNVSAVVTVSASPTVVQIVAPGNTIRCEVFAYIASSGDPIPNFKAIVRPPISDEQLQHVPSTGSDGYAVVDAIDADYISANVEGAMSLFGHAGGIAADEIFAVVVTHMVSNPDGGSLGAKQVLSLGVDNNLGSLVIPTATKRLESFGWPENPDTSADWTAAEVNDAFPGTLTTTSA